MLVKLFNLTIIFAIKPDTLSIGAFGQVTRRVPSLI